MAPSLPIQTAARSRTLRVTWWLTSILAILPIFSLWVTPWLRSKSFEVPVLTEPGTAEWIIVFVLGSIGCVVLLVGQILAFQNRKVSLGPRAWAAAAVAATVLLWAYWFYATTTRSVSAAPMTHSVRLTWKPSTSPGVRYNIYRSTNPNKFTPPSLNPTPIPETSYVDNTVEGNKIYYYSARAVDAKGNESPDSNIAKAVIPNF
ncbi:MAG TPA: hypothetical protein VGH37_18290 [Candidatus Acidoferrum sp.]